ncbi:unnamed protein product [Bursaphelenchus okinawaensis]|uniref:MFS domain-containing protein n=1 Tax=Bursaphelenchus okinawaensis TaxID=465554 RepID=A0A811L311_9BILA|nr:unnamed protein product [Bursaphelenchus okinawaensis]CAG9115426.1 unnamed protein product [Bursaphelenchus okinawaensis]
MSDTEPLNPQGQTPWNSIYITSVLTFVSAVQYSLYFAALWPYMKIIDPEINANYFGLTVFAYSVEQIIAAPLFGKWSNVVKEVKQPLCAGLGLMFLGNLALLRTYVATASTSQDKSKAIAYVTCGQALGMSLGPAFQIIFTVFGYPGISFLGLHINIFTAPAYFACLMNIAGAVWLSGYFVEAYAEELNDVS